MTGIGSERYKMWTQNRHKYYLIGEDYKKTILKSLRKPVLSRTENEPLCVA